MLPDGLGGVCGEWLLRASPALRTLKSAEQGTCIFSALL